MDTEVHLPSQVVCRTHARIDDTLQRNRDYLAKEKKKKAVRAYLSSVFLSSPLTSL